MAATIAFFGATGGSTVACLALALEAGYDCSALSRSTSKLQTLLLDRGIPQSAIDTHLTIIEGDIRDAGSVSKTLSPPANNGSTNTTVPLIISGIGRPPNFSPNPLNPTFDDPTICQDAITAILDALRSLPPPPQKPLLVALSTTGISSLSRDVPLLMLPLYHYLLAVPHKDKKEMERLLVAEMRKAVPECAIGGFVVVRPSLLTDGKRLGTEKVRVGVEVEGGEGTKEKGKGEGEGRPAVGYTISRDDVGGWMFDEIVRGGDRERFVGKMVSITY